MKYSVKYIEKMSGILLISLISQIFCLTSAQAQNVGIGTTAPTARLHIVSDGNTNGNSALNITDSSGQSLLFVRNDGNVGINTVNPDNSALLDITANDRGVRLIRLTTTQRDLVALPTAGLVIYNSTTRKIEFYDGVNWRGFQ